MGSLISLVAGGWQKWAAIAAVVALLAVYIGWLKWDIATYETKVAQQEATIGKLNSDLDVAVRVNADNLKTLERVRADAKRAQDAVVAANARAASAAEKLRVIGREIERVPADQNFALGATVRDIVKRLWEHSDAPAARGDAGGKTGSSSEPLGVPARAR